MGDYAAKELGYKRAAMIADDLAYGHELNAGFQRAFEDAGGKVVQKLWPPLISPDYGTYIAQLKQNVDVIFIGFAGSNGFKFFKQYKEYGGNTPILGGMTAVDESLLQQMGDEALGMISTCWYSAQIDSPTNKKFVDGMNRDNKVDPGFYAAATYTNGAVLEAALAKINGKIEDKNALMAALRGSDKVETARGPVSFDKYGNVIGNVYIRKVEKKGGKLVNSRDQDLSQREPVLDLQSRRVPQAPRLQSRDVARKQESRTVTRAPFQRHINVIQSSAKTFPEGETP